MSLSTQHIIRHLFRVESLEEVSRQQLEELVEAHPSFGVGRYLLSRKLQAEQADHFSEETQKTNLYFTNPFWLQWLLQEDLARPATNGADHIAQPAEWNAAGEAEIPAEEVFAPVVDPTEPTIDTEVTPEEEPDEVGDTPSAPTAAEELLKSIAELREQRQAEQAVVVPEEGSPSVSIAGLALEQIEEQETAQELSEPVREEPAAMEEPAPVEDHISAEEHIPVEGHIPVEEHISAEGHAPSEEHVPAEGQTLSDEHVRVEGHPRVEEYIPSPADQAPIFEPYHTVDYFASQGIRLVQEENPSDRLGKQLKSFTDWLKVMRKLPQKNREIVPDIAAERQVQAIAAHSIEREEVVTEAMAEVLAKQGMREKATEMYRKLSLLEPEKSAYFADKIEKLKIV